MEYVDYHLQPIVRGIPSYSKDTSNFLRVLKTHHRNSRKFVPWNTWCKITLNKHPKLKWNKMSKYIPWKPYENGSNHKDNNYFLSSHSNSKYFLQIIGCTMGTICATILWKFIHDRFWAKTHVSTYKRKIINIFQIHWWYISNLERNKRWTRTNLHCIFKCRNKCLHKVKLNTKI